MIIIYPWDNPLAAPSEYLYLPLLEWQQYNILVLHQDKVYCNHIFVCFIHQCVSCGKQRLLQSQYYDLCVKAEQFVVHSQYLIPTHFGNLSHGFELYNLFSLVLKKCFFSVFLVIV